MECPKCGKAGPFAIECRRAVIVIGRSGKKIVASPTTRAAWHHYSDCDCVACGFRGREMDFRAYGFKGGAREVTEKPQRILQQRVALKRARKGART